MWQLPEIRTQADEIYKHETEMFKVIMKKNGIRMTITPALRQAGREAAAVYTEQQRAKSLLGLGGKQIQTTYKCPFAMASCNGKTQACKRCESLFENGDMPRPAETAARAPCPFNIDSCKSQRTACADCKRAHNAYWNAKSRRGVKIETRTSVRRRESRSGASNSTTSISPIPYRHAPISPIPYRHAPCRRSRSTTPTAPQWRHRCLAWGLQWPLGRLQYVVQGEYVHPNHPLSLRSAPRFALLFRSAPPFSLCENRAACPRFRSPPEQSNDTTERNFLLHCERVRWCVMSGSGVRDLPRT
jgi:hypothetical protein